MASERSPLSRDPSAAYHCAIVRKRDAGIGFGPTFAEEWARDLEALEAEGLRRRLRTQQTPALPEVVRDGRALVNLASNNYLGLAADPRLVAAAHEGLERWGVG